LEIEKLMIKRCYAGERREQKNVTAGRTELVNPVKARAFDGNAGCREAGIDRDFDRALG
jgi:hypothetical protein